MKWNRVPRSSARLAGPQKILKYLFRPTYSITDQTLQSPIRSKTKLLTLSQRPAEHEFFSIRIAERSLKQMSVLTRDRNLRKVRSYNSRPTVHLGLMISKRLLHMRSDTF